MGKGSNRRPCLVSEEESDLRWKLALGQITREQFDVELGRLRKIEESTKGKIKIIQK
jgi:hypothetical protein